MPPKHLAVKVRGKFVRDRRLVLPATANNRLALYHGIRAYLPDEDLDDAMIVEITSEIAQTLTRA